MSYFKKKQFIALVAKLKMPGQPVQRASSRKRRDGARNLGQEASRRTQALEFAEIYGAGLGSPQVVGLRQTPNL